MARPLNAAIVENHKPHPSRRLEIPDGALVGLYLVVQPSGAKSWAVRYRATGRPRKVTLGPYPRLSLKDARDGARETLRIASEGGDPAGDRETLARLKRSAIVVRNTFEEVLERFLGSQQRKGLRSVAEIRRILEKDALPVWRGRPIASITAADVVERVESILARGKPVAASRFRAWCSKLFSYAVHAQLRPDNPAKGTENPIEPRRLQRDRKLDDAELVLAWHAAEQLSFPFGPMVQLLLITGQRLREVAEARWTEFDLARATWTIPAARAKNGVEHTVALSVPALAILQALPRIALPNPKQAEASSADRRSPFLFTTVGETPVSGFSKAKARLDALIRQGNDGQPIAPWRLHDLRRSFVSGCARLRIPAEIVERAINHVSESFGGVRGVYNVHAYEDERRDAMTAWAGHVVRLLEQSSTSNVVAFRGA